MSIESLIPTNIKQWLEGNVGVCSVLRKLHGGKNNQAFLLKTPERKMVLKQYFADDNRCLQEVSFARLLSSNNIPNTPELICAETNLHAACFAYVEGHIPECIDDQKVRFAAEWLNKLNTENVRAFAKKMHIPVARGALLTIEDFANDLTSRLKQFNTYQPIDDVDLQFDKFLQESLAPAVADVVARITSVPDVGDALPLCLSPSDIGFHNVIEGDQLYFLDFEYAGWDSIDKLVNDFFAQPRYDINIDWMQTFINTAFPNIDCGKLLQRSLLLLPSSHLKWALIFLNDFRYSEQTRRSFSNHQYDNLAVKAQQLEKAKKRVLTAMDMI